MRRFVASKLAAIAATAVLIAFGGVNAPSVAADTSTQACQDEFHLQNPSSVDQTPVVFVHGWMGETDNWESMNSALESEKTFRTRFNYYDDHNKWVTHPNIGPKLAREIDCLARLYHKDVVVVAHSMGGLTALQAGNETVGGRKASDVMGLLITIGTPYQGSPLGNIGTTGLQWLCNDTASRLPADQQRSAVERCLEGSAIKGLAQGSGEIARLPKLPSTVPIRNIAGNMTMTAWTIWGNRTVDSDSDMVVSVTSATANYTNKGVGDGKKVFECEAHTVGFGFTGDWCSHNGMLRAPQVQADVRASIEKYLASVKPKPATPSSSGKPHTMYGMTLYLSPKWNVVDNYGSWLVGVGKSDSYDGVFDVRALRAGEGRMIDMYTDNPKCDSGSHSSPDAKIIREEKRPIGNKWATRYTVEPCADNHRGDRTLRIWEIEVGDKRIEIDTSEGPGYIVPNLDGILASAIWN